MVVRLVVGETIATGAIVKKIYIEIIIEDNYTDDDGDDGNMLDSNDDDADEGR